MNPKKTNSNGDAIPKMRLFSRFAFSIVLLCVSIGCSLDTPFNSPYPSAESTQNIFYSSFSERPKHLDPVRSYSSNEYTFIAQIYEPPFQYHYLKSPYELAPLTAQYVPRPFYYDARGKRLPPNAPEDKVVKAVYEIRITPGIQFQNHPAFAKESNGEYLYHNVTEDDMEGIYELQDFEHTGTRELTSADYVYQIKRMANPLAHCPIAPIISNYVAGFAEYAEKMKALLAEEREKRKKAAGAGYNQEKDEVENPILLDLRSYDIEGVKEVDRYTFRITLKSKYPQFIYWMAMPFFAPMPWEAEAFYAQGPMVNRQISLNWYPVGTGPYRLAVNNPNKEMVMLKNENFHKEFYPSEGTDEARDAGLLKDAGKRLPFIEKAVYRLEKEDIPYWTKFLQGYYDTSGITSDSFDMAINIGSDGNVGLTESMKAKNIRLSTSVRASTFYIGFNMLDDVVGGYTGKKNKLRQAISIAVEYEEYIQIFMNGRGLSAQSPLPPGIFGFQEGEQGVNPYVYDWENGRPVRKGIDEAKKLLAEAGYPGGKDEETGKQLLLYFDTASSGPDSKSFLDWLRKQFKKIDIELVVRSTDYNRFQGKMLKGSAQIFQWGWNADYPDPENFLFLLYGPNKKVGTGGENASNYENPQFDSLFSKMSNMENGPKRSKIINKMLGVARKNAPWLWGVHPIGFGLYHEWYENAFPNMMANNTLKYKSVNAEKRAQKRAEWNKPIFWPIVLVSLLVIMIFAPVVMRIYQSDKKRG